MYNPFSLLGKTILITGASSGIGRATAIECSRLGAKCIITGRNQERLNETLSQMEGAEHQIIIADLSESEGVNAIVNASPQLNGIVANAGYTYTSTVSHIREEHLKGILQVNTVSAILLLKELLKQKKLLKGSSAVYTCSISGLGCSRIANSMYAASKGAIYAFTKAAALELASKGIRVNTVCPGMIATGILDAGVITEEQIEADKAMYPLRRHGRPEEVAWGIIYLLSDASDWVTGTDLLIDGGRLLK